MSARSRRVIVFLLFVAVLVPLVPLVLWSLTQVWPYDQVLPELSLRAWAQNLANRQVVQALANSLVLSALIVVLSLAMGFMAAKNLGTRRFRGRGAVRLLLLVPTFVPQIALVFGMQKVFSRIGLYNNYAGVVVALLVFYVPYMTLLLSAVFESYDLDRERQAAVLGVGRWKVLWHVTLPSVRSGVIVSCVFTFIGTWSAYLVVSAVASPAFKTMALLLFPMINSASNGYALTAGAVILYIMPMVVILAVFSKAFVNDTGVSKLGV